MAALIVLHPWEPQSKALRVLPPASAVGCASPSIPGVPLSLRLSGLETMRPDSFIRGAIQPLRCRGLRAGFGLEPYASRPSCHTAGSSLAALTLLVLRAEGIVA